MKHILQRMDTKEYWTGGSVVPEDSYWTHDIERAVITCFPYPDHKDIWIQKLLQYPFFKNNKVEFKFIPVHRQPVQKTWIKENINPYSIKLGEK